MKRSGKIIGLLFLGGLILVMAVNILADMKARTNDVFRRINGGLMGGGYYSESDSSDWGFFDLPTIAPWESHAYAPATEAPAPLPTAVPTAMVPHPPTPIGTLQPGRPSAHDAAAYRPNRLIIKNGEIQLLVADTETAQDRVTQVINDLGGYTISSQIWYQEFLGKNYKYATLTIAVPAEQFELALQRFRKLALRVQNETASGQDVTDEYVDLKSRLTNLEATRDRIREFLSQTKNVEEAIKVNAQLSEVEGEIEQVQGRMNYLFDRAAYSTITLTISPDLPLTPTPTPRATPTATPTPTPTPSWNPGSTAQKAGTTLQWISQNLADLLIWIVIVIGPFAVPALLIYWIFWGRKQKK